MARKTRTIKESIGKPSVSRARLHDAVVKVGNQYVIIEVKHIRASELSQLRTSKQGRHKATGTKKHSTKTRNAEARSSTIGSKASFWLPNKYVLVEKAHGSVLSSGRKRTERAGAKESRRVRG